MNISNTSLYTTGSNYYSSKPKEDNDTHDLENKEQTQESEKNSKETSKSTDELTQDEKQQVAELQARDVEVRAHEAAHQAAGGGLSGGASFTYQQGPDGKSYAIGGEVPISMPGGSTPEEKIANAQQVIAAALAPADPSAQDMSVAASARSMMMDAQQEKTKEAMEANDQTNNEGDKKDDEAKDEYSLDTYT
jgi:hypothetical protein